MQHQLHVKGVSHYKYFRQVAGNIFLKTIFYQVNYNFRQLAHNIITLKGVSHYKLIDNGFKLQYLHGKLPDDLVAGHAPITVTLRRAALLRRHYFLVV